MENNKINKKRRNFIKIALIALVGIFGGFTFLLQDVQQELSKIESRNHWILYSPSDERFRVHFPTDPKEIVKQIEISSANRSLDFKEMQAEESEITYAISYLDFPRKWRLIGSNTLLKKALQLLIENEAEGQQLAYQNRTAHNGFPALDYLIKVGEREIQGRLILAGTTLYRLTASYNPTSAGQVRLAQFVNSFNLDSHA